MRLTQRRFLNTCLRTYKKSLYRGYLCRLFFADNWFVRYIYSSMSLKYSLSKNSFSVIPAPSQKRLIVITLEHFVLPLIRSYIAEGDIPALREASQMLRLFSLHISYIRFTIASFKFIIVYLACFFTGFHNYYMVVCKIFLVEFHDIDTFV